MLLTNIGKKSQYEYKIILCKLAVSFWLFTIPNQPVNLTVHSIKEYAKLNSEEKKTDLLNNSCW